MNKKRLKNPIKIPPAKADDQPATREMLKIVRGELREEIKAVNANLQREISDVKQMMHRSNLLFEEQNGNNRVALEGLQALW